MIDITQALLFCRPGSEWTLNGDDYEGLTWLCDTPKPTLTELEEAYALAMVEAAEKAATLQAAQTAAIAHAKSLGFTDAMIAVMYPNLGA